MSSPPPPGKPADERERVRFLVKVSCCGSLWFLYAPAFGTSRMVADKRKIREAAHEMIAQCGAAPAKFGVDLALGRVVDPASVQELTELVNMPQSAP